MIIGQNFVFIHVPKCAGSSFTRMMKQRHGLEKKHGPHASARDIPLEIRKTHYIFGFMRDPVEQAKSNFIYHTRSWGKQFDRSMSFEQWCEWRWGGREIQWGRKWIFKDSHVRYGYTFNTRPSAGFYCDENGDSIASHIYRFEDMKESLDHISETIGLDCNLDKHKVLMYSKGPERQCEVTPRCVELIRSAKAIDFDLYGKPGDVSTNFTCPTVPRYYTARPEDG